MYFTEVNSKSVTINKTEKDTLFQHKVTGVPVITPDDSRFKLTWSIHKDNVSCISCDGDCDVIIFVNTRSPNTFKYSFSSCEYIGLYSSWSAASILNVTLVLLHVDSI